jgi:hypothetical protein
MISPIGCVDLLIVLLPWGPLALKFQKSSPGFGNLYAYIGDCEQIGHHLRLFHDDLLHSLDITDPVTEGVDDLDVLNIRDIISGVAETFDVVPKTLIMLLPDGFMASVVDGRSYVPWKFPMNMTQAMDALGKLMSHDLVAPVNAVGRKLAFTRSSPSTTSMIVW